MTVTVTGDNTAAVLRLIKQLTGTKVLIGIPSDKANRDGPVNNASIGYMMENGMPEHNVPARPFLVPGVKKVLPQCMKLMKQAGVAGLAGDVGRMEERMNAAGQVASSNVRNTIIAGIEPALSPETVKNRAYARESSSQLAERQMKGHAIKRRDAENDYLDMIAGGASPEEAQAFAGITPLINTSQLLKSITYVLRKANG